MKSLILVICLAVVVSCISMAETQAQSLPSGTTGTAGTVAGAESAKSQPLALQLKQLQEGLAVKEAELAKLRHRWIVSKGRTPTAEELKEFEEKRVKGKLKPEDNPYVNRNALNSAARRRAAYYAKVAEMDKDREAIARLRQELEAQNASANKRD